MKPIVWDPDKNEWLKQHRYVSFELTEELIINNEVVDTVDNPSRLNQKMFLVKIDDYIYAVPYVEDDKKYFLKTIYPSRKYTKQYLKK